MTLVPVLHNHKITKKVFDEVQEGILVMDKKGVILEANEKFQSIVNLSKNNIVGLTIDDIMPNLSVNKEICDYKFKKLNKLVFVRRKKIDIDNDYVEVLFVCENHFNLELAQKYTEVKQSKEIFESILNSIDEGVHVSDVNGKLIYINPTQEKLDGLEPGEAIGKHWLDVYDLDEETSLILRVLKDGKPVHDEYQNYVVRNGKYISVVCSSVVPLHYDGKLIGAAAINKDYIRFKEIAEKILSMKQTPALRKENNKNSEHYTFTDIIGENRRLLESVNWSKTAAKSESPVLIYGETGTGKEMFAQSIHYASTRSKEPFIAINCAAIPENLLEGILFGTTKGAFTGAIDRIGLFEQANNGTLFLDEINSMPPLLQSKLLRVLEEKKIMRLGGKNEIPVNVRIIASCNVEPTEAIDKEELRSDLFYRLAVIYITIPPLFERLDDLPILIDSFINSYNKLLNKNVKGIDKEVLEKFYEYYWPGNVRQLKHCIECAMNIVQQHEVLIKAEHIPVYLKNFINGTQNEQIQEKTAVLRGMGNSVITANVGEEKSLLYEIFEKEKNDIIKALRKSQGNIAKAARTLGMSRQKLHYRVKKYNLK